MPIEKDICDRGTTRRVLVTKFGQTTKQWTVIQTKNNSDFVYKPSFKDNYGENKTFVLK